MSMKSKLALFVSGIFFGGGLDHAVFAAMNSPISHYGFKYSRGRSAQPWALLTAVCMLVAADRVTHVLGAVNKKPLQDIFAQSDAYEQFMGRWSRRLAPLLVKFASVDQRDFVLDVGSGTGALAFALAEAAPSARVTGVDPSNTYVRYAQVRTRSDRVRFLVGDAQALDIPNATFDKTLCS
jgi:SAM-dependent methyltransferase